MALAIAVAGAAGRMGRTLIEAIGADPDLELSGALEAAHCTVLGERISARRGAPEIALTDKPGDALAGARVLVDFTQPRATLEHLAACVERRVAMVIGTTGFDDAGRAAIEAASHRIGIVFAPNMSVGVNVTLRLVELAAALLGEEFDAEVIEIHHRKKVDAPSGTALRIGEVIAAARGRSIERDGVFARHGLTGERSIGSIGFSAVRGGDIVGDHTALFAGSGERIEITHRSGSRLNYAVGSLRAARFIALRERGLFDMQDVLGLRS
jgi:4-hydroxy-tetrahydrodipicolinate reductase